jgi:ankyrin repeat protein
LFKYQNVDFTSNPLHLQMISETEGVQNIELLDVISLYEQFIKNKIKYGLETCWQIKEGTYLFPQNLKRISDILTRCAEAEVMDKKREIVQSEDEINAINLSGLATVVDNTSPLEFVHLTFAEFLTAQKFIKILFGLLPFGTDRVKDEVELKVRKLFKKGVSRQTMHFIEGLCCKHKDKKINAAVLGCFKDMEKEVFEHICHAGMHTFYSFLVGFFNGEKLKEWMLESLTKASLTRRGLYFYACRSSPQLARLLSEWRPMLLINDVDRLLKSSAVSDRPVKNLVDDKFSTMLYELVRENCPDLDDDGVLQIIYSSAAFCKNIFPLILHLGVDLSSEKNGIRLSHIMFRNIDEGGDFELLDFAIKVAKHFQGTENLDSVESLLLRKNIGAKSPQELELDTSSLEGHCLYLRHIVECACALLDVGICNFRSRYTWTSRHGDFLATNQVESIADEVLRPIAITFKLHILRDCSLLEQDEALNFLEQEQQWIPRDFKYSCGCSLVHDAVTKEKMPLLETLGQHGFDLTTTNNNGETPLHWSIYNWDEGTEFLLKRLLRQFYVSLDAKREEIVARTPDEQRHVEDTLGKRDIRGRTPLLFAVLKDKYSSRAAELLIYNLLGPLVIPLFSEELVIRSDAERKQVERILSVRDSAGFSALHGAVRAGNTDGLLELMLKNLLGEYFIDGKNQLFKRTLEKQKQIAQLLQPKNNEGITPLLNCTPTYNMHRILLMNLLGEYFVEESGLALRPLDTRTDEENNFVQSLMFDVDVYGRSPYDAATSTSHREIQILYEANANKYMQKPQQM